MAYDSVTLNAGSGGDVIATDLVSGQEFQRVKIALGAEGVAADAPVGGGTEAGSLRVTIANDSSGVLSVDDNGGSLTVDGSVSIAAAIPAGTNNIGDVDVLTLPTLPAGTNNIGDVDVLSVIPGTGATNLGKAEDAAHTTGDVGVMALAVRQDSQSDFGADGDYVPLSIDADGAVRVAITSGAGSGGTAAADDADFTAGSTSGTPAMGVYESTPTSVTDGDLGMVGITQNRAMRVNVDNTVTVGSHAVTNAGTFAVQVSSAIPAGTNNIGDVDIASALPAGSNNIGDVDVLSVIPGTAATNLGKAEDAAHSSGDVGVMALAVRQNSQVDFGADGDYVPLSVDDNGGMRVSIVAGAGSGGTASADDADFTAGTTQGTPSMGVYESSPTSVTDGDLGTVGITQTRAMKVHVASGGVSGIVDDAAFTPGTTEGVMFFAEADDTTPDSVDEGDAGALRMSLRRELYTQMRDAAGNERGANVNASNALLVAQTGALPAGTNNIGDVDILTIAAGDNNIGNVDIVTMPNVTLAAGTNTNEVVGDAAHDAAIAGNPVRIAGRAATADYTAVAAGDVADILTTTVGKQVNYPYALPGTSWSYAAASGGITDTTGVTARAAAGAGVRNYITRAQIMNGHATVSTDVQIRDGASGTVLWRGFAQAAGGGCTCVFDPPLRGTANTLVEVANGTTGSAVYFNLQGFTSAE